MRFFEAGVNCTRCRGVAPSTDVIGEDAPLDHRPGARRQDVATIPKLAASLGDRDLLRLIVDLVLDRQLRICRTIRFEIGVERAGERLPDVAGAVTAVAVGVVTIPPNTHPADEARLSDVAIWPSSILRDTKPPAMMAAKRNKPPEITKNSSLTLMPAKVEIIL